MAIAFDASSSSSGTGDRSWTHTPVGTPRGVLVMAVSGQNTDTVVGMTYGGVPLVEVPGSPNILTLGDLADVHAFFLGSGIPTGAQTVSVDKSDSTNCLAVAITMTAADDCSVVDTGVAIKSGSQANPSETLSLGGVNCFCAIAFMSGQDATSGITPLTDWTSIVEDDFGSWTAGHYRYNTIGSADVTAGWTQTAAEACAVAVAIREGVLAAITGDLAATESGSDTAAMTASVIVHGAVATTESGSDTAEMTVSVVVHGNLAATEAADTAAMTASVVVHGDLAATETGLDVAAFTGRVGEETPPAIHGFKGGRKPYRKTVTYADGRMKVARSEAEYRQFVAELLEKMARDEAMDSATVERADEAAQDLTILTGLLGEGGTIVEDVMLLPNVDPAVVREAIERHRRNEEATLLYILATAA